VIYKVFISHHTKYNNAVSNNPLNMDAKLKDKLKIRVAVML